MFLVDRRVHALFQALDLDEQEVWERFEIGLEKIIADHERAAAKRPRPQPSLVRRRR
jgi:hypothetical protein